MAEATVAEQILPNYLATAQNAYAFGQQQGAQKRGMERESRLAALAQQAYGAAPDQRDSLLQQAVGVDPDAGLALSKGLRGEEDAREQALLNTARMIDGAPPGMKDAIFQQARPRIAQYLPNLPPAYNDQVGQGIKAFIASRSGAQGGNVQSRFVGDDGFVYSMMRDGQVVNTGIKADRQMWFRDHPGMAPELVGKDGQIRPVGQAQGASSVVIDPNLPPNVQAAIRGNPGMFAAAPDGGTVTIPGVIQGGGAARPSEAQTAFTQQAAKNAADLAVAPDMARAAAEREAAVTRARETAEAQAQKMAALPQTIASADETIMLLDRVLNHPGRESATGVSSMNPLNKIPGTDGYDFNVMLDQIKGQSFLQAFQSLKGGGAITEREGQAATNAIARLNAAQSEGEFVTAINDLKRIVQQGRDRAIQGATGSREQAAPAQQQGRASLPPGFSWED